MSNRRYDVVLYGASGFVGQQTVRYFAQHTSHEQIRWAIAGRNRQKLEQVKQQIGVEVDVIVADSQDQSAIDDLVSQTRVVLNTAGPFALYGNNIVDACVRFQTDYVDITGETPWVKNLISRYHEQAAANGTRIIPFCGFDSIPSDLGTYLVAQHFQQTFGIPCPQVKAYFQAYGGFNGGTLASGFNLYDSGQIEQVGDPFLLNPSSDRPFTETEIERNRDPQFPFYDTDEKTWVAPFFMGPINTRVVRRSWALFKQWGESERTTLTYQEYLKFDSPLGWLQSTAVTATMGIAISLMQPEPIREFLRSFLPQPGSGPSEQIMNNGWFRCELLGIGEKGQKVRGVIYDQGDPGNRATVKFLCESALCLALNRDELPGGSHRGGILTPATGLGNVLAKRLQNAVMSIEIKTITN